MNSILKKGASQLGIHYVIRIPVKSRTLRLASIHECPFPSSNTRGESLNRTNRFCWKGAETVAAMALLVFSLPLRAQSLYDLASDTQQRNVPTELRDDDFLRTPEIGTSSDSHDASTAPAVEGAVPPTAVPEIVSLGSSDILSGACTPAISCAYLSSYPEPSHHSVNPLSDLAAEGDKRDVGSKAPVETVRSPKPPDFNQSIYYKNKLEFGLDVGWLPINIPFVFDVFLGDGYTMTPLRYTLVPIIASVRWHMGDVAGPSLLRGNWDLSASASAVVIPRGPETRYYAWIMGIRRNFVQRNWKIAPYFDGRLGLGNIDAKEPLGVIWSQGQDFTFTVNLGSGVRYNFNPRYSISACLNWMHISNLYLSEPQFPNYGINVYGPMFGIDVRIGKPHHQSSE
jgi:hypothetical protein